jgi:hypothetical protein
VRQKLIETRVSIRILSLVHWLRSQGIDLGLEKARVVVVAIVLASAQSWHASTGGQSHMIRIEAGLLRCLRFEQ